MRVVAENYKQTDTRDNLTLAAHARRGLVKEQKDKDQKGNPLNHHTITELRKIVRWNVYRVEMFSFNSLEKYSVTVIGLSEWVCVCVCEWVSEWVGECVCVCMWESVSVCVCVCEWVCECVSGWVSQQVSVGSCIYPR